MESVCNKREKKNLAPYHIWLCRCKPSQNQRNKGEFSCQIWSNFYTLSSICHNASVANVPYKNMDIDNVDIIAEDLMMIHFLTCRISTMSTMSLNTGPNSAESILRLLHVSYLQESSHVGRPSAFWMKDFSVHSYSYTIKYMAMDDPIYLEKKKVTKICNSWSTGEWHVNFLQNVVA